MSSLLPPLRRARPAGLLCLALALSPLVGCVSRGYPTHGGGKRFFQEQALVAGAIDAALAEIDFGAMPALAATDGSNAVDIGVHLFAVAHSGGGVQNGSTGVLSRLFGSLPVGGGAQQGPSVALTPPTVAQTLTTGGYMSFGFESADDIRYLMGRMIGVLGQAGLRVRTPEAQDLQQPVLCVLVRQLGIDQSDFDALVYTEKSLRARADLEVFLVHLRKVPGSTDGVPTVTSIGRGTATMRFREDFFLGFGPLRDRDPELEPEPEAQEVAR